MTDIVVVNKKGSLNSDPFQVTTYVDSQLRKISYMASIESQTNSCQD